MMNNSRRIIMALQRSTSAFTSSASTSCPLVVASAFLPSPQPHNLSFALQLHIPSIRCFSSRRSKKKRQPDPFKVLGIKRDDPYSKAKESFIQIAMSHHPDTNEADTDEERDHYREIFIKARRAFEQLTSGEDGEILLKREKQEMEDFDAWFKSETGHDTPFQFMDAETMKEVAEMEDTVGHGLDRDGGMWLLASMVGNAVKKGQQGGTILQLEAGEVQQQQGKNAQIDGVLRRRRKPGRR